MGLRSLALGILALGLLAWTDTAEARSHAAFETDFGRVEIELFDDITPGHVKNFLTYVNHGDYTNSIVHRSISGFVIQGGAWVFNPSAALVPTDPSIPQEIGLSNLRGTISMALSSDPNGITNQNSATSQWFINVADNTGLDSDFTVFGRVTSGMNAVDTINAQTTVQILLPPLGSDVPLKNWIGGPVFAANLIYVQTAREIPLLPGLSRLGFGLLLLGTIAQAMRCEGPG